MSGPKTPATFICADVSKRTPSAVSRFCLAALLLMLIPGRPVFADEANSASVPRPDAQSADSQSLSTIFQDEALQDNSISIQNSAAGLPVAERFELLANWVLPGNLHPTFRVTGEFGSTDAHVGVTWKNFDVLAEEISGLPLTEQAPIVAALNARRELQPARRIEFVDVQGLAEKFLIGSTGDPILTAKSDDGLRITNTAGDASESCILVSQVPFGRGADVELKFDVHQLGHPDRLSTKSEIALKVFFDTAMRDNSGPVEATFILRQTKNGTRDLVTRIVFRNAANRTQYRPLLTVPVKSPDAFRTVVHEGTLYFLYSEAGSDDYRIASTAPVIDNLPATGVELKFVANGKDHKSDLTIKKLIVHESEHLRADLND